MSAHVSDFAKHFLTSYPKIQIICHVIRRSGNYFRNYNVVCLHNARQIRDVLACLALYAHHIAMLKRYNWLIQWEYKMHSE